MQNDQRTVAFSYTVMKIGVFSADRKESETSISYMYKEQNSSRGT